jgi:hypothetical protein
MLSGVVFVVVNACSVATVVVTIPRNQPGPVSGLVVRNVESLAGGVRMVLGLLRGGDRSVRVPQKTQKPWKI